MCGCGPNYEKEMKFKAILHPMGRIIFCNTKI